MAQRELRWRFDPKVVAPEWTVGFALLVLTKATDLLTTIVGLTVVEGLAEKNPVGALIYREIGIVGLIGASIVGVLLVVVVVELAGSWIATLDDCSLESRHLYLISYLPLILVYLFATINNSILVLRQLG